LKPVAPGATLGVGVAADEAPTLLQRHERADPPSQEPVNDQVARGCRGHDPGRELDRERVHLPQQLGWTAGTEGYGNNPRNNARKNPEQPHTDGQPSDLTSQRLHRAR